MTQGLTIIGLTACRANGQFVVPAARLVANSAQSHANRCKLDGTNIGTPQKLLAATPNHTNVYAIRKARWKCGAGKTAAPREQHSFAPGCELVKSSAVPDVHAIKTR